ncbi:MAG: HAMP domain-containing sensor histidine kinase [Alysiella sp.]|uniref:sensor histidine kinase n=1 Tax=Alysiella sp. TaxID=1872483 RepID=UPI0026DCB49B|nr:HAMP domain-containing sensor histidine kinase [Alysiella sp.]MDO4434440.1 HAMP domain-containing sensor histidine kinase [Alysiella sp.]
MKLFQRIFATFCLVIICVIAIASFSSWFIQQRVQENQLQQQRNMETALLANILSTFQTHGEQATRNLMERWRSHPAAQNIIVVSGSSRKDLFGREVGAEEILYAYEFAIKNPKSNQAVIYFDPFGEEYLFFIRHFHNQSTSETLPLLIIPGLPIAPVWHEFIIFASILLIGLLIAYIVTTNITQPIAILERAMKRLASGELDTRVSQQLDERKDELSILGQQFDRMAAQLQILVEKERHLLHHVSHEMRSPLARIQAIIGLLQARPDKQADYIARLESELTRMDILVGELLTLSRLETANMPMEKESLPIVAFMEHLLEDSQAVAQQNQQTVSLEIKNLDKHARFEGNESYLYRALDNVIRNAMNYSPASSTIHVQMYEDRKNLHITVTDNGPGIKEEQIPHIFTAFYRADSSNGKNGTGLGLAIAKHVTEQHNGKLIAQNVQPNGLQIHFIFPKTHKNKPNKEQKAPKTDKEAA